MDSKFPCKKVSELPVVVNEWQGQDLMCPDCNHYYRGMCSNPTRDSATSPCPFDGKDLPLRKVEP